MQIPYTSWDGKEKTWNPQTDGFFFIRVSERIVNADGSYFGESTLGRFSSLSDVQTAYKAILCVRPELRGKIQPVKSPCAFDAHKTYVPVERWY